MDKNSKFGLVEQLRDKYISHDYIFIVNTSGLPSNSSNTKDENSGMKIVGVSDGKAFYGADYIKSLATMPSMEVIRASLLSVIQSLPTKIAYSLLYCPTAIGRVISSNFKSK